MLWQGVVFSSCGSLRNMGSEPIAYRLQRNFLPKGCSENCRARERQMDAHRGCEST